MSVNEGAPVKSEISPTNSVSKTNEKPAWGHFEEDVEITKEPRKQYWDTMEVVGARRQLSSVNSSQEKRDAPRPGFFRRIYLHVRRYWILYSVALLVFLAIILPIL